MANGSERSVIFAAAAYLLRELARVSLAFTCVSVTYLVSGIPYGSLADSSDPFAVRAHTSAQPGSSVADVPRTAGARGRGLVLVAGARHPEAVRRLPAAVVRREPARRYPVAYYLHGMWGDEWNWVRSGGIDRTLDSLIARGHAGDDRRHARRRRRLVHDVEQPRQQRRLSSRRSRPTRQSETVDAYCVPWPKYDDYIARDLVARVDSSYRTIPSRDGARDRRAEHGRLRRDSARARVSRRLLRGRQPLRCRVAAVHGPASRMPPPPRYATTEAELRQNSAESVAGDACSPSDATRRAGGRAIPGAALRVHVSTDRARMPALMLDVGVSDDYVDQSRDLHATLQRLGVAHAYAEWPGAHNWDYWRAHARESLQWIGARIGGRMEAR